MKQLLILLLIGILSSCGNDKLKYGQLEVKEINGCQYVVVQAVSGSGVAMVHAANCNNPIHQK